MGTLVRDNIAGPIRVPGRTTATRVLDTGAYRGALHDALGEKVAELRAAGPAPTRAVR